MLRFFRGGWRLDLIVKQITLLIRTSVNGYVEIVKYNGCRWILYILYCVDHHKIVVTRLMFVGIVNLCVTHMTII